MKIFAIGKPNKKADLSLSINAIVIVVLAMTLLGLGLGFIRNMFKNIGETTGEVTEQVRAQILEDLRTGNKKLSFPSTEVSIDKDSSKVLALGVKNTKSIEKLDFMINARLLQAQVGGITYTRDASGVWTPDPAAAGVSLNVNFFFDTTPKTLSVTEADVYSIKATASATAGTYMSKIEILEKSAAGTYDSIYAEKTFFINVI